MQKKKLLIAGAVAVAISVAGATPALALDVEGTPWNYHGAQEFGFEQVGAVQGALPYAAFSGDGMGLKIEDPQTPGSYLWFNCGSPSDETVEDDLDVRIDCNNPDSYYGGDLTWDGTMTVFAGDLRGIVGRQVYTLTNASSSPLTLNLRYEFDTEECNSGVGNVGTSSGDTAMDDADAWLLCNNNDRALENHVWGDQFLTSWENNNSLNTIQADVWKIDSDGFALAAGESATLVFFLYSEGALDHTSTVGDTDANILANATSYFDVTTMYGSHLWEDLTVAANWSVSPPAPEVAEVPTLANTGTDTFGMLFAAIALAGVGVLIVARRRSARA